MKSFVSSSRFIQPRRFKTAVATNERIDFDNNVNTAKSSPDTVVSTSTKFNIADIICNIEQVYDSSLLKWDDIRKSDEREHALMQGMAIETNIASSSSLGHVEDENDIFEVNDCPALIQTNTLDANVAELYRTKSESLNQSNSHENHNGVGSFHIDVFAIRILLLLFILRASYIYRINI
jgi:hypothetical protein